MSKIFTHLENPLGDFDLKTERIDGKRHYVAPGGERYLSATGVLSVLSADSIKKWRKRVGEQEANKVSRKASGRGTKFHTVCEHYLDNHDNYLESVNPDVAEGFVSLQPHLDRIDNVVTQEQALYSDTLCLAGRADCIAEFDGIPSIIDFKTSLKPKKEEWIESYWIQTEIYAYMFTELTEVKLEQKVILINVWEGEPQIFIEPVGTRIGRINEVIQMYLDSKEG